MSGESPMKQAAGSAVDAVTKEVTGAGGETGTGGRVDPAMLAAILDAWPKTPAEVARNIVDQYGPPNEATETRLIWHRNGPWKRTIVYRDDIPHNFPSRTPICACGCAVATATRAFA